MELVLVSLALTWAGLGIVDSIAAAVLLIVLVRIVLALASFLLAWCFRSRNRDQEPLGPLRLIALVAGETVSFLRLFFVYHAFEPWLNAHDPTPQSEGRTPPRPRCFSFTDSMPTRDSGTGSRDVLQSGDSAWCTVSISTRLLPISRHWRICWPGGCDRSVSIHDRTN